MSLPAILFVIVQTDALADGGIASISQVIAGLRDHRPVIVTDREGGRADHWRGLGLEVNVIPQCASFRGGNGLFEAIRSYWRYFRGLRLIIKRSGARVVHANDPLALQLSIAAAKMTGAKLLFNLRGTFEPDNPPSRLKYSFLFAMADHVLFLSSDMARRWAAHVPNAVRSFDVTYSAVDLQSFAPSAFEGEPQVLVSALIRPLKGQLEFIRNAGPLLARSGVKLCFAGDFHPERDPYMAACAEAAEPLGGAVLFLGYRSDVPKLIASSAVIAVTSRHEGLVRSMLEAMSSARPVVSFDVCSAREILEEQSGGAGTVVENGDHEGMARAILEYCGDRASITAAGSLGRAAALRLFAPEAVIARYENAYRALADRRRAAKQ